MNNASDIKGPCHVHFSTWWIICCWFLFSSSEDFAFCSAINMWHASLFIVMNFIKLVFMQRQTRKCENNEVINKCVTEARRSGNSVCESEQEVDVASKFPDFCRNTSSYWVRCANLRWECSLFLKVWFLVCCSITLTDERHVPTVIHRKRVVTDARYLGTTTAARKNFQRWSFLDSSGVQSQPDPLRMTSKGNCNDGNLLINGLLFLWLGVS